MPALEGASLISFLVAIAVVVVLGRAGGELARRFGQPEVLGQLVAGVLLGPSVLGLVSPAAERWLLRMPDAGHALSGMSWLGALMVLFAAGAEVDLRLLREHQRAGLLAAFFAIVPSFLAGAAFGHQAMGLSLTGAVFLGIVLSVTAISVASALLIEWQQTRREFAQVVLAAGIAGEVSVWIWVAVAGSSRHGDPLIVAGRTLGIAVVFFAGAVLLGRRLVNRAMRLTTDHARIVGAPLSLALIVMIGFAALTQALGLHALLGAFVAGVLLAAAPRANEQLLDRLTAMTRSLFAPVFFVLAGSQVDVRQLASGGALVHVVELFVLASVVKVAFVAAGVRMGGFRGHRAWLVGAGLNARGGTDVVVAIVGHELGLLPSLAYTSYTVVAILTVLITPGLIRWFLARSPTLPAEADRLQREDATARAWSTRVERVLLPVIPELCPTLAADVIEAIALAEERRHRSIDVTRLRAGGAPPLPALEGSVAEHAALAEVDDVAGSADPRRLLSQLLSEGARHDLVVIGAQRRTSGPHVFGELADEVVREAPADVLVVVDREDGHLPWSSVRRILVPTNGLPHARAAADLAGLLAQHAGAEVSLLHVAGRERRAGSSAAHLDHIRHVLGRLDIPVVPRVRESGDAADTLIDELRGGGHGLVVVGAIDRGREGELFLGATVEELVAVSPVPVLVLVTRPAGEAAAAA